MADLHRKFFHICIVIVLGSLSHWLTRLPSTPQLSASTLVFLSLSPSNVFMIALPAPSWSWPPLSGICKLACVQLHTHDIKGAISWWIETRLKRLKSNSWCNKHYSVDQVSILSWYIHPLSLRHSKCNNIAVEHNLQICQVSCRRREAERGERCLECTDCTDTVQPAILALGL